MSKRKRQDREAKLERLRALDQKMEQHQADLDRMGSGLPGVDIGDVEKKGKSDEDKKTEANHELYDDVSQAQEEKQPEWKITYDESNAIVTQCSDHNLLKGDVLTVLLKAHVTKEKGMTDQQRAKILIDFGVKNITSRFTKRSSLIPFLMANPTLKAGILDGLRRKGHSGEARLCPKRRKWQFFKKPQQPKRDALELVHVPPPPQVHQASQ